MSSASDTIVIKAPPGTKARWVRQSQADGLKLSDWIVSRTEARAMNVYKIPETLADKHHGTGSTAAQSAAPPPTPKHPCR